MMKFFPRLFALAALYPLSMNADFSVKNIEILGLKQVPKSKITKAISIKKDTKFSLDLAPSLIDSIYATGYFSDVSLYKRHQSLLVKVNERPSIYSIDVKGNKLINKKTLDQLLLRAGLHAGNMLNLSLLKHIKQSLLEEYAKQGKFTAKITITSKPTLKNHVIVNIKISEGITATISNINIVGNKAFKSSTLSEILALSTPGLLTFFNKKDEFSQAKLQQSLMSLRKFYVDHGYYNFRILSSETGLSKLRKHVFLTINIHEGQKYTFKNYKVTGNYKNIPDKKLHKLITIKPKKVFSKQEITESIDAIQSYLKNKGYAFAKVVATNKVDDKTKQISVDLKVTPKNLTYINHIIFKGNKASIDKALRQKMLYQESSLYNLDKIMESKIRLQRYSFIEKVQTQIEKAKNYSDKVNVTYKVKERNSVTVHASLGYSELDKIILGGSLKIPNILGTGNTFTTNVQLARSFKSVNLSFVQPFFTKDGVQQSIDLYAHTVDNNIRRLANYSVNAYGGALNYAIPLNNDDFFNIGGGAGRTRIIRPTNSISKTVERFFAKHRDKYYNTFHIDLGWSHNSTDRAFFPTTGLVERLNTRIAVPGSDFTWYKIMADTKWFYSITSNYVLELDGGINYGNGYGKTKELPFFEHFHSGGWNSVRGYYQDSMGPHDTLCANSSTATNCIDPIRGRAIGGNLSVHANLNFYFPIPFMKVNHNMRTGFFLDAGNVYSTKRVNSIYGHNSIDRYPTVKNLRYSVGLQLKWISPIGPIGLSLAMPLNDKPGDELRIFQFSLGYF
ncbi:MAG: outer membrane protein assembly factor BamA [Thiotrichales bacterium]|nr:MAG: outer membrane protein assembly factor BamA [Thiotrichales bacterium]